MRLRNWTCVLLLVVISAVCNVMLSSQSHAVSPGTWQVVNNCSPNGYKVNAIHASLTRTGKVLITAGSGYNGANFEMKIFKSWLWNPQTPSVCPVEVAMPVDKDIFCAGHTHLKDGEILFFGGTSRYGTSGSAPGVGAYYGGIRESYIFDDVALKFVPTGLMTKARWYPSGVVNAAGTPIVVGGLDENSIPVNTNETYNPATGLWSALPGIRTFPMYAGLTLKKSGVVCYTGTYFATRNGMDPQCWNWSNNTSVPIAGLQYPDCRDQASGLLMPPAQLQKYMVIGGGCKSGVTGTTAVVDLNSATPKFVPGPYLGYAAMHTCADILPDWSVFVTGGGNHNVNPQLEARRLPYAGTAWEVMAKPTVPRLYHSSCLLLPDGTVVTMGTNSSANPVEARFEVYKPWYAQVGVVRPNVTTAPSTVELGKSYPITYTGSSIKKASLMKLGSVTHSSDPNKRLVELKVVSTGAGKATLTVEPNWGVLPLGVYMLSITDSAGVPSVSRMVKVVKPQAAPAPASNTTAASTDMSATSAHAH